MLGTTLLHLNALPVPLLRQVYKIALFGCLFLVCFLGCFLGAQRGPKGSPKWSKINQKEVSKRHLKKGTKKAAKMTIFMTLECGQSVVNKCNIDVFQCSVLDPFWVSFWRFLGATGFLCRASVLHDRGVRRSTSRADQEHWSPALCCCTRGVVAPQGLPTRSLLLAGLVASSGLS